jgi:hypothetical protein
VLLSTADYLRGYRPAGPDMVVGLLAAIMPARRAARTAVVTAMTDH